MPFENARSISRVPTSTAITQGRFVVLGASGQVAQATVAGSDAIGVAAEASATGDTQAIPVSLLDGSLQEVEAGAAIDVSSAAVNITTDTSGRAITAATGNAILGIAVSSASGAGEIISFIASKAARASA